MTDIWTSGIEITALRSSDAAVSAPMLATVASVGSYVVAPLLDDDNGLLQAVEDFTVQAFVAQFAIDETRSSLFPVGCKAQYRASLLGLCEPVADDLGRSLRAVVESNIVRNPSGEVDVGH